MVAGYETMAARAAELALIFPRHKAPLNGFEPASDVIGIGNFDDSAINRSMAIFASLDSAQRFVASDPLDFEGLARRGEPLAGTLEGAPDQRQRTSPYRGERYPLMPLLRRDG